MGWFSGKKKTYVSSVTYPLGEDGEERVDFLKYTVINATLQGRPVGESLVRGYLGGQGIKLRNAFHYARDFYTNGVPTSAARYFDQVDTGLITAVLATKHPGSSLVYLTTAVGSADYEWFAEKYLTDTYGYDRVLKEFAKPPDGVDATAAVAYDLEPNGLVRILLMNADGATKVLEWRPTDYVRMANYVHCCYQARNSFVELDTTTTRPATPGEVDSVSLTQVILDLVGERQLKTTRIEIDIAGDTATVWTKKTVEVTSRPQYFLYRLGTGTYPALDALQANADLVAPYYPSIPLRVDNVDYATDAMKDQPLYKTGKKLLSKVGVDLDELADQVKDNKDVGEIDFAFVAFGVSLNTKSQEGKRYLFRFFEMLRGISGGGANNNGGSGLSQAIAKTQWEDWAAASQTVTPTTMPQGNVLEVYSAKNRDKNHDIKLQWNYIDTTLKSGVVFPGAKPGDVEISMDGERREFSMMMIDLVVDTSKLYARRQIDADTYEELEIAGLVHENFVYQGKSVVVTAYDAFHDKDEEGFIVPLNQQIVRQTPMVEITDLSYQCMHMVFNCYKVVKQKWYQTTWFKVVLIIVAIIITVVTWGADGGSSLAAALSYGAAAALGATGLLLTYLAATIYVLGMMVLAKILGNVATSLFGDKWGAIIAMIATIYIGSLSVEGGYSGLMNGAAISSSLGSITAVQLLQYSTQLYGAYAQGQMAALAEKANALKAEYTAKMDVLEDLMKELREGSSAGMIDIAGMTKATQLQLEAADTFLARTLLTGSDICEITVGLVENFVDVGLRLPTTG